MRTTYSKVLVDCASINCGIAESIYSSLPGLKLRIIVEYS
jgi:hypothetical protein